MQRQVVPRFKAIKTKASALVLPGKVTSIGWQPPAVLSEEEWQAVGACIVRVERCVMWVLGDWWKYGDEHEYGSRKAFAEQLEAEGGFSFGTCMNAAYVSGKIQTSRRREVLPWTFHYEAASLKEPKLQDKALAWAEKKWPDVTVREMRAYVRILKRGDKYKDVELPTGKWRVFYADPPWDYGNERPLSAGDQDDHWPPMPTEEICALPVADRTLDDAVLFLWTTTGMMLDALQVIEAWGFVYKTEFVWDKIKHNMGHYSSVRHEPLLLATRGSCTPDERKLFDSVYSEERAELGRKPDFYYEMIERLYPFGKKLEIFARRKRKGWDAHGNEI